MFAAANDAAGRPCYQVHILSPQGGAVTAGSGVRLLAEAIGAADPASFDTVLVAGGNKAG
ncbi:AraC family transcriptional regulator, partial [Halobellus sp. Atlit-31R]